MEKYTGIFLFGAILLCYSKQYYLWEYSDGYLDRLILHEKIHGWQAAVCGGYINFYSLYLFWYVQGLIKYRSHNKAYENIKFEIQARRWVKQWA
jgi:hypothetical protein